MNASVTSAKVAKAPKKNMHLPLKKISGGNTSIGSAVFPKWFVVVLLRTGSGYLCSIEYC